MSNLPSGIVSSLIGINPNRDLRYVASPAYQKKNIQKIEKNKRPRQERDENRTMGYLQSPSCNFSFATTSGISKNKLISKNIAKILEKSNQSHINDLSLSKNMLKFVNSKKQVSGLNVSSTLLDRIKKRQMHGSSEAHSPKDQKPIGKPSEMAEKGKYLNIALSNAKNFNMFEINNYYSSPQIVENMAGPTLSVASNSIISKTVEHKALEIEKKKTLQQSEFKNLNKKITRCTDSKQISSLQANLTKLTSILKNRHSHAK